ncbi:MAG: thioesterase family protein [bacterium]|nr:thioesterase family protein [bacterium]
MFASPPPEGYRYYTPMTIRYGDMDTLGHVNNAKYNTYFEQARISYIHEMQLWDGSASELGLIVAKVTVEYKLPLSMSDGTVDIWTRVCRLGNKSFDMEHLLICQRDGEPKVAATGLIVMVVFNYVADQTVAMPDDWRRRLIEYEPILQTL